MKTILTVAISALLLAEPALAQQPTSPPPTTPPQTQPATQAPTVPPPPTPGELPSQPLVEPSPQLTPPPTPPEPQPRPHRKRPWVGPLVIALEVGAVAFAIASITVISVGGPDDTWRYPLGAGLGGGTIACAGVGVIIGLVAK